MKSAGKTQEVTANLPAVVLNKARRQSGKGFTETLRLGLELVAAQAAHEGLRSLKGELPGLLDREQLKRLRERSPRIRVGWWLISKAKPAERDWTGPSNRESW